MESKIIIFDIIKFNGLLKTQEPFSERRKLLEDKFKNLGHEDVILDVNNLSKIFKNQVMLSPQWKGGIAGRFRAIYDQAIKLDGIEGLVIKSLNAKMELGTRESPVVRYMYKVRKPGPYGDY